MSANILIARITPGTHRSANGYQLESQTAAGWRPVAWYFDRAEAIAEAESIGLALLDVPAEFFDPWQLIDITPPGSPFVPGVGPAAVLAVGALLLIASGRPLYPESFHTTAAGLCTSLHRWNLLGDLRRADLCRQALVVLDGASVPQ